MTREEARKEIAFRLKFPPLLPVEEAVLAFFEKELGLEFDEEVEQWDGINGIKWRIVNRPGEGLILECSGGRGMWHSPEDELKVQELMRREIMRPGKSKYDNRCASFRDCAEPEVATEDEDAAISFAEKRAGGLDPLGELRSLENQRPATKSACSCQFTPMVACSNCAAPETFCPREPFHLGLHTGLSAAIRGAGDPVMKSGAGCSCGWSDCPECSTRLASPGAFNGW